MSAQRIMIGRCVLALLAFERLLARMLAHMHDQRALAARRIPAIIAQMRAQFAMDIVFMQTEHAQCREGPRTDVTFANGRRTRGRRAHLAICPVTIIINIVIVIFVVNIIIIINAIFACVYHFVVAHLFAIFKCFITNITYKWTLGAVDSLMDIHQFIKTKIKIKINTIRK